MVEVTLALEGVTSANVYKYTSLVIMGLSYIPQLRFSYKRGTPMNDISYTSLCMLVVSGLLWTLYMYEQSSILYAASSLFVTLNVITLISMKAYLYMRSVNEHYKTFQPQDSI
jgi:uncharacterized protein with PQ loop repeat